jgi:hypothetical protein
MMDQLASIGVAFQDEFIEHIFQKNVDYYENPPNSVARKATKQWAIKSVYDKHKPVRPWGLGKLYESENGIWKLAGSGRRTPGLNKRANPDSGLPTNIPMEDTNERIHSSVRVRLDLDGLDLDDKKVYACPALLKDGLWRLSQVRMKIEDPIPWNATWGPGAPPPTSQPDDLRWVWEYVGPDDEDAPLERFMVEERLGPYERKLLLMNKGEEISSYLNRDVLDPSEPAVICCEVD